MIGVEYYHILYFLESCEKTPFEIQSFAELLSIRNRWLPNWMNMVRDNLEPHDAEAEISEAETMHTAASAFFETNNDLLLIPEPVLRTLVHAWRYDVSPSNYIH